MTDVEIDDSARGNCHDLLTPHKGVSVAGFLDLFAIPVYLGVRVPILVDGDNVVGIALIVGCARCSKGLDKIAVPGRGGAEAKLVAVGDPVAEGELLRVGVAFTRIRLGHKDIRSDSEGRCTWCRRPAVPD